MIDGRRLADGPELVVQLAADKSGLPGLVDQIEAYAAATALPETVAMRLMLVCEEWAANVVEHGTRDADSAVTLRLLVRRCGPALHVVAEDDGRPFDPLSIPAPDLAATLEERCVGGLGLHLMRRIAQDLRYERAGSFNRLALALTIENDERHK